jgi:pyrimidine-nucleoside phosphorylase
MQAVDIITKKRDGKQLTRDEIAFAVQRYTAGEIPDYQMSALLMAIYLRGMTSEETVALTMEMLHSGIVVDFSDLGRQCVDKHSTGGVGDKTSLVIAPVVAAAGLLVPMISGRGLGHSGGTLDKLEAIPGFRIGLSLEEFRSTLDKVGAALIGQTAEIAPADRKLYALRDVTATVASLPLMAASIMSKKLAEGIDALVLDVKVGSGAFVKEEAEADKLARMLVDIAHRMNKKCIALITCMEQPLGAMIGNSLEVIEALDTLAGKGPEDLTELCRDLSAHMLVLGGRSQSLEEGRRLYDVIVGSGRGLEKLGEIIRAQGGDERVVENYALLPLAGSTRTVSARSAGYVESIDTEALGHAAMLLGAGRSRLDAEIDPGVGLRVETRIGQKILENDPLATVYFNAATHVDEVAAIVEQAFEIGPGSVEPPILIKDLLS